MNDISYEQLNRFVNQHNINLSNVIQQTDRILMKPTGTVFHANLNELSPVEKDTRGGNNV